jgi:alpha-tubulin suppressor-like RCC1 family protein
MKSTYKFNHSLILSVVMFSFLSVSVCAYWRDDAKVIKISGGEHHSLALTSNKWLWAFGDNLWYQLGIGDTTTDQYLPVRVHAGDMNTLSGYLENIDDFDAGWRHSLALDVNGFVWSWGEKLLKQIRNKDFQGFFACYVRYDCDKINEQFGFVARASCPCLTHAKQVRR